MADSKRPGLTGAPTGRRTFSTAFRGFDQEEVRAYLEALAVEFRELRERITELEGELETERARPVAIEGPKLDVVCSADAKSPLGFVVVNCLEWAAVLASNFLEGFPQLAAFGIAKGQWIRAL